MQLQLLLHFPQGMPVDGVLLLPQVLQPQACSLFIIDDGGSFFPIVDAVTESMLTCTTRKTIRVKNKIDFTAMTVKKTLASLVNISADRWLVKSDL